MLEWLKNNKQYAVIGGVVIGLFGFYIYSSVLAPIPVEEEEWELSEEVLVGSEVEESFLEEVEPEEILVDVKGAVKAPGVYEATEEERVVDLIEKAGGLTEEADSKAINFAMKVDDEMVLYVPVIGEEWDELELGNTKENGKVNINKAGLSELETLPGIGPAKAEAILEYRETNGPFKNIEDIMSVSGFGQKTFDKLQESITVR